jgi:23S rRNA (guanosine2251-2'-O)-methyltransferase
MKPPRSDRSRGAPSGAKPPHKPGRPHASTSGTGTGGRSASPDRSGDRDMGKRQIGTSHAGGAGKPRFAGSEPSRPRFMSGKPQVQSARAAGDPARFRPERDEARPVRPLPPERSPQRPPARVQDRARESLTRDRESGARETVTPAVRRNTSAPHAAEAPRGTVWLYGLHAVQAALANPARRLRRLVVTEEGSAALAARLATPWALAPETVDRARIDQLLGRDAVHQGAALLADLLPQPVLATALERPGPVLILDQVTDPRNIGAILRSAAAFGVAAVIVQERHAPEETGSLAKAASGALETVPLLRAVNLARTIVMLKAANLWIVGLDAEAKDGLDGAAFKDRRVALVLGGEGGGLRRLTRESCDELAKLPMAGIMESLNVSAATAVALYELGRHN